MVRLSVDGSPAACRASATELRRLVRATGDAGDGLAAALAATAGAWEGGAGDAFRRQVRSTLTRADADAAEVRRLAADLDAFADGLDAVRQRLDEARGIAVAAGIHVADALPDAVGVPPGQQGELARAVTVAVGAREREASVHQAWQSALATVDTDPGWSRLGGADLGDVPWRSVVRVEPLRELAETGWDGLRGLASEGLDLVEELEGPPVPLPLPPLTPRGAKRSLGGSVRVVRAGWDAGREQWEEDAGLPDRDRWARAVFVGGSTTAGAVLGIGLCTRVGVPPKVGLPVCGTGGAWLGERAAERVLEGQDARR